jgi:hypothetical protein
MSTLYEKKLLQSWEAMLAGLRESTPRTVRIAELQAVLTSALQEALEIRDALDTFTDGAADARENLARVLGRGRDAAMAARNYLRFHFGPYNDELRRFGVTPIRRGKTRKVRMMSATPG